MIAVITDEFWQSLKSVVKVGTLDDPKFDSSIDRLKNQAFIEGMNLIRYFPLKHQIIGLIS